MVDGSGRVRVPCSSQVGSSMSITSLAEPSKTGKDWMLLKRNKRYKMWVWKPGSSEPASCALRASSAQA